MTRPTRVRFLFDGGLKGVGELIARARGDVAVIGSSRSGIPDVQDEEWFPIAGQRKLIVIRRDGDVLNQASAERRAWERHGLRGFVLTLNNPQVWDELLVIARLWDRMENHVSDRAGELGWVARVNKGGVRPA